MATSIECIPNQIKQNKPGKFHSKTESIKGEIYADFTPYSITDDNSKQQPLDFIPYNLKEINIKKKEEEEEERSSSFEKHDDSTIANDHDDGNKTPTGMEHRIPIDLPCPGAPRKSRPSSPGVATKRRRISSDNHMKVACEDMELLFPPRSSAMMMKEENIVSRRYPTRYRIVRIKKINNKANNLTTHFSNLS